MFLVRKFLFVFFLIASLTYSAQESPGRQFLNAYYSGQYEKAHSLLQQSFPDALYQGIWDARIHYHREIDNCSSSHVQETSAQALALLRIGSIDRARELFAEDWPSLLARATLASWQNDLEASRQLIERALFLNPQQPELLLAAGDFAGTGTEAEEYFSSYMKSSGTDPRRRLSVGNTLDFLRKTREMKLNVATMNSPVEMIESEFDRGRLMIQAEINGKPMSLLLDTGASGLSLKRSDLSPKYISNLMMVGLGKNQVVRGNVVIFDQLNAGNFQMTNTVAALNPTFHVSGVDGVIGSVLFSQYSMVLPMKKGVPFLLSSGSESELVTSLASRGITFEKKLTFPFYRVNKMIILKGKIEGSGEEIDILLDTGAQRSVLSTSAATKMLQINYRREWGRGRTHLAGMGGRIDDLRYVRYLDVQMGPLELTFGKITAINLGEISEALQLELDFILGRDALQGYTLIVDYKNNKVTFLK